MAGEDYTSPINGKTYRVPKYEEPADAPVAFKDFADNLPPGGIDFDPDRVGQVVQSLDGAAWDKGMALQVVDAVPDDGDGEVGDVVFIPGGPGGLPLAGGGKILQVVRETDVNNQSTTSTSYTDAGISVTITPTKSTSAIILLWSAHASPTSGVAAFQDMTLADSDGNQVCADNQFGSASSTSTYHWATVIAYVTPATTSAVTYKGQFRSASGTTARISNSIYGAGQLFAFEVEA